MSLLFQTKARADKYPRVLKALKNLSKDDWRVVVTESAQRMNGETTTLLSKRLDRIVGALVKLDQKTWRDVVAVSAWPAGYAKTWGTHGRGAFIHSSAIPVRKALDIAEIINTNGTGTHEVWDRMDAWVAAQGLRSVLDAVKSIYADNGSTWSTGEENWWISQLVDKP